ncbi:hypothetical protein SD80_012545 [Scytonema tolypothrichoides VB-61278]|nr:hypothetical protein SD80_012545 [Scytonema tolypothrichoides VB-61278]
MNNMPDLSAYGYVINEEVGNYYYEDRAIYRARDQRHGRLVVLKEHRFFFNEPAVTHIVQQERDTLQTIAHPGIPRCLDCFVVRDATSAEVGSIILVLEDKPGSSLEKGFRLSLEQLHHLTLQVLAILAYGQTLNPPVFHHTLNLGDIVVDYLPQGQIEVAVLNFGKVRETPVIPNPDEKWQYDLQKLGGMLVRLLTGQATAEGGFSQQHFSPVSQLVGSCFQEGVQRLLGDGEIRRFQDATQAYQYFATIPVMTPPHLRRIPFPTLLGCFAITMLLCAVWYGWAQVSSLIHGFGKAIAQFPVTVTLGFAPGQQTEVNAVYVLAGVLFATGVLLGVVCACLVVLEGVLVGIVLILLAALVLGMYWLASAMLYWLILLAPITVTAILLLSFYRFLVRCWRQMRQENFTVFYTVLTMLLGILAAVALISSAVSVLFWHRHLVFFALFTLTTFFLWLSLLAYPGRRYQADLVRQRKAQALVLKG